MNDLLGIVLPSNNPEAMHKYLIPSLKNITCASRFLKFLINFQSLWNSESINNCVSSIKELGFEVDHIFSNYVVKTKGLVPVNKIREDTARIDPTCKYYLIFDDDMSFLGPSLKMRRSSGEQLIESIIYMKKFEKCGVLLFGGTLIKNIPRDSISQVSINKEYATCRGIVFRNMKSYSNKNQVLLPDDSYELLGSDEEKVIAGWRISEGFYVAEMPFVRINHYENQLSKVNKSGKIPGYKLYSWNTDEIRENNNYKFIRDNYNKDYTSGKGNIVDYNLYKQKGGEDFSKNNTFDFSSFNIEQLCSILIKEVNS